MGILIIKQIIKEEIQKLNEDYSINSEINDAKKIFEKLQKMYPEIPKFPLEFKNLNGRASGYLTTSKFSGGKHIYINKMTIDNSEKGPFYPDYTVCHEFAHAILAIKKGSLRHDKTHEKLTYELAHKFGLA